MAKAADTILERLRHQRALAGWQYRADRVTAHQVGHAASVSADTGTQANDRFVRKAVTCGARLLQHRPLEIMQERDDSVRELRAVDP
jgi:hypothetical protein